MHTKDKSQLQTVATTEQQILHSAAVAGSAPLNGKLCHKFNSRFVFARITIQCHEVCKRCVSGTLCQDLNSTLTILKLCLVLTAIDEQY